MTQHVGTVVRRQITVSASQERAYFGCENQSPILFLVIKRLNSKVISCEKELLPLVVPDCNREHAIESSYAIGAMALVQAKDGFGVAVRSKCTAVRYQFLAQFEVIVNFAVKHHSEPSILGPHGHMAGRR